MVRALPILPALLLAVMGVPNRAATVEFVCAGFEPPASLAGVAGKTTGTAPRSPSHGTVHALVVYAKFRGEQPAVTTAPASADRLFDPDLPGSLTHFYTTMSSGQFQLTGTTLPRRYESRKPASAYLAETPEDLGQFGSFAAEILRAVDEDVDFGRFDNDGPDGVPNSGDDDGFVDYIFINLMSTPNGFIIGGATGVAGLGDLGTVYYETRDAGAGGDPIQVSSGRDKGSISREGSFAQTVGTMAHEFGHALSLQDLYDQEHTGPEDDSAGIGRWGLMGSGTLGWNGTDGPNSFSAWSLEQLGWIGETGNDRLIGVEGDATGLPLLDRFRGGSIYRVPLQTPLQLGPGDRGDYLLFERRIRSATYYDRNMPGEGILVWHVSSETGNKDEFNKRVDLICADGLFADAGHPAGRQADGSLGMDNLDFWAHDQAYAANHAGNLGDATDPFDGIRYRGISLATNPSTAPGDFVPAASSGLSVSVSAQGENMALDVVQPRWSGVIDQPMRWEGRVLVAGDVFVDPAAVLTVEEESEVLFAPGDEGAGGDDPERSELRVRGSLTIGQGASFSAQDPLNPWHGIVLMPSPGSSIVLPDDGVSMHHAEQGLTIPGAPPHLLGDVEIVLRVVDEGLGTAGNGDGHPGPGETFRIEADLTNWTFNAVNNARPRLEWSEPDLEYEDLDADHSVAFRQITLSPGVTQTIRSDPLRLSDDAKPGGQIDLSFDMTASRASWSHAEQVRVTGEYPQHTAGLSMEGVPRRGNLIRVPAGQTSPVEAIVTGEIERAQLVLYTLPHRQPIQAIPLHPDTGENLISERSFVGQITVPEPGMYEARLMVSDVTGATVFSTDTGLSISGLDPDGRLPALAFINRSYSWQDSIVVEILEDLLAPSGRTLQVIAGAPEQATTYDDLLPHYYDGGDVLWLSGTIPDVADTKLQTLLEEGGNLLAMTASANVGMSLVQDMFHVDSITRQSESMVRMISLAQIGAISITHPVRAYQLRSPAHPLFLLGADQVTGSYVNGGTYRGLLFPFSITAVPRPMQRSVLKEALAVLSNTSMEAKMEINGHDRTSLIAVPVEEPAHVTLRIDGKAERADLIAYPLVEGQTHAVIPMQRITATGEETAFEASVPLNEGRRYVLSPVIRDAASNRLFAVGQLELIGYRRDADALVLIGRETGEEEDQGLRSSVDNVMDRLGWRATYMREEEIAEYTGVLSRRYGEAGKTIVKFGGVYPEQENEVRRLLSGSSRVLIVSDRMWNNSDLFMRETLRVSDRGVQTTGPLSVAALPTSADLDVKVPFAPAHLVPPAVPLIIDERGRAAGWYIRGGPKQQLAYLSMSFGQSPTAQLEQLVEQTLRLLEWDTTVELDFPGSPRVGNSVLVRPGERLEVTATSPETVSEVVMWSNRDMRPVTASTMEQVDGVYRGSIVVPREGLYAVAARTEPDGPAGSRPLAGPSMQMVFLDLNNKSRVLAFLPDEGEQEMVSTGLIAAMERLDLEATIIRERIYDADMLAFLLESTDLVVWASDHLWEQETAILKQYLERGGRLLLASEGLPDSEWGAEFLRGVLGVTEIGKGNRFRSFLVGPPEDPATIRSRARTLGIDASAQTFLLDSKDEISGIGKTTDTFRAVFLPLRLRYFKERAQTTSEPLADLFESGVRYLSPELDGLVEVTSVRVPAPFMRMGPLSLEVVVANQTSWPTAPFRVGFQVSTSDSVVAHFEQIEAPLDAGAERVITLDDWRSTTEGKVEIHAGIGWLDGEIEYQAPQTVHVLDLQDRFTQIELPAATGAGFFDFDGDGDEDLYLTRLDVENLLLRNDGDGAFAEADVGLADAGRGRGMAVADFEGDGDLDLYLVNDKDNRLFENTGSEGGFVDATVAASIHAEPERSLADNNSGRSAGFFDGDRDGDLDLYLVNAAAANRYYQNEGGVFFERAGEVGLDDAGDGRALTFGDYDGDGDVDLFVANQDGDALLRQDGTRNDSGGYVEVHAEAGITSVPKDIGCVFGDYDNDGDLDLFIANQESANRLYRNRGDGTYETVTASDLYLGAASVGSAFGDFDNDGDLDLATTALSPAAGGDEIYHNQGDGRLLPVGSLLALNPTTSGRALSMADVDRDGDLDLFVVHASNSSALYVNSTVGRNWLQVILQDIGANQEGLGAVVELVAGDLRQRRSLQPSFGYLSHGPAEAHFGLGEVTSIDTLRVHWPDGHRTVETGLDRSQLNQRHLVSRPLPTSIAEADVALPTEYELGLAFPNPFNSQVTIPVHVPRESTVHLEVFNITGQRVRSLVRDVLPAGTHRIVWDGKGADGQLIGTGTYILRLQAGEFQQTQRVLLLK